MTVFVLPPRGHHDRLAHLAEHQSGVLTREQLAECGIDWDRVRNEVAARRWQVPGRTAVVMHNGPITQIQQWWLAALETGPWAILDGLTAAEASGLSGYPAEIIHVSTPKGSHPRIFDDVRVHELRRYRADDVHPIRKPPQARPPIALLNAALWSPTPNGACAILAAGVQQRLIRPGDLRVPLARIKRHRHRRIITATVADIEGGAQSLSEIDVASLCRSYGLPPPKRQSVRRDALGRRRYLDTDWPEYQLSAEIDGGLHMLARTWWDDMDRLNEIVLTDRLVLRFPSVVIRLHPERVATQLARGLRKGGCRP